MPSAVTQAVKATCNVHCSWSKYNELTKITNWGKSILNYESYLQTLTLMKYHPRSEQIYSIESIKDQDVQFKMEMNYPQQGEKTKRMSSKVWTRKEIAKKLESKD